MTQAEIEKKLNSTGWKPKAAKALAYKIANFDKIEQMLIESIEHHEYCGYGDSWERECAEDMIKSHKAFMNTYNARHLK